MLCSPLMVMYDDTDTGLIVVIVDLRRWKIILRELNFRGCGLPPISSLLFVQCNELINCVDYRFRHVRLEC